MVTIHEHQRLNPVIFDKVKHISNLWNWDFEYNSFDEFEYYGDDNDDQTYDEEIEYNIKGLGTVMVYYEIYHSWIIDSDGGDWYNPPTKEIVHEETNIYVNDLCFNFDVDLPSRVKADIEGRLEHLILLSLR